MGARTWGRAISCNLPSCSAGTDAARLTVEPRPAAPRPSAAEDGRARTDAPPSATAPAQEAELGRGTHEPHEPHRVGRGCAELGRDRAAAAGGVAPPATQLPVRGSSAMLWAATTSVGRRGALRRAAAEPGREPTERRYGSPLRSTGAALDGLRGSAVAMSSFSPFGTALRSKACSAARRLSDAS
jgi:hypothetical protein